MAVLLKINMIKFYLHIPELPGWDYIFSEIIEKIATSGLVESADEIHLCLNGNLESMLPVISPLLEISSKFILRYVNTDASKWEWPTINAIKHDCDKSINSNYFIGYAHLKGLTSGDFTNSNSSDWRDYLVYWTIEKWKSNVDKLSAGYRVSGVNWFDYPFPHFSGNFWWATSNYIQTLDPLQDPSTFNTGQVSTLVRNFDTGNFEILTNTTARFECEAWIGSKINNSFVHEIHSSPSKKNYNFAYHYKDRYPASNYRENK